MEEWVGWQWHRLITRAADRQHADARVTLAQMERTLGLMFRAGGGSASVRMTSATATRVGGARHWLQKVAGSGTHANLPRLDEQALALPPELAVFDTAALNRDLYLWLAALAACAVEGSGHWLNDNLAAAERVLLRYPGLRPRLDRLVQAHLQQRPDPASLKKPQQDAERAVRETLEKMGSPARIEGSAGVGPRDVAPVWLWLESAAMDSPTPSEAREPATGDDAPGGQRAKGKDRKRRRAEQVTDERHRAPLMMFFRAESILSWGEFVKVNRASDDDPDDNASKVADDMDVISVAPDGETTASRVRFDLDLPSAAADDRPLGPGVLLPEWDYKRARLVPDHCSAQCLVAQPGTVFQASPELRATTRRVRRRLEVLRAAPRRSHARTEGEELDLDAWVRHQVEGAGAGQWRSEAPAVFSRRERTERSLATLLLADLSLSTDAYVWNGPPAVERGSAASKLLRLGAAPESVASGVPEQRVIDVIRDALYVFGEALHAGGDAFEMLGFSSVRRQNVRIQHLKGFDEPWNETARQRVGAVKPGYYTRMGAAIRLATQRLSKRPERQRLLLLLTDGKPNDLDVYEGRYGLEDTRHAIQSARDAGLTPFCVTIDEDAHDYLPMLFGQQGYARVQRPRDLVHKLAHVYAALTRP